MSRRASVFDVTRPKFPLVGSAMIKPAVVVDPAMLLQLGWLMKLKISALNWSFCSFRTRKFLNRAMSHCCSLGFVSRLRGALPNVPAAGALKAAGLNQ